MEKHVLFKTVHGSRLYGLANWNSDEDFYTVVDKVKTARAKYAKQTIVGQEDTMLVDFGTWLNMCERGVPQALEAMFSEMPLHDDIEAFRAGYRVGTQVYDRYLRTIKSFAMEGSFKRKRHALRLAVNMCQMREYGRFNPTLDRLWVETIDLIAHEEPERVYEAALKMAWS